MTPSEERAFLAGAGTPGITIDEDDEDMVEAVLLATTDQSGGILWRPSTLQDVYDVPARVLRLFLSYRAGQNQAAARQMKQAGK